MIAMIRWGGTVGRTIQSQQMKAKDGRILLMNEILQVLDKLKLRGQTGSDYRGMISGHESAQAVRLGEALDGKGGCRNITCFLK